MRRRISSPVTRGYVAPPVSPLRIGAHGGDSESSVCRGGLPTQRFVEGLVPLAAGGGGATTSSPGPPPSSPPPAPPPSMPDDEPRPTEARLPCGGASCWSSGGTGAYSCVSVGLDC